MSKARYHLKARAEAVVNKCRPECTLARCLCRLDGPQEPKGGYHGIRVRQPRRQGPLWLQMGKDEGAPLVYFHQVKHMWVGYVDCQSGTVGEDEEAGERQAKAQILMARKMKPKQAVLWMQMQRDAQVAACVDSTSRTVEVWGPTRQVLAMALYVEETVRRSRGMAREWDSDTEMHRMRKVMATVDYDGAAGRRAKGHTIQVVSAQASAAGAADQGVTDLGQDGHTWWVVEPRGDRRQAAVYTAAPLKRVEHPLMRWVGEVEEVRVERTEDVPEKAVLRALESQMDRCAETEEAEDIREQIRLALEWVTSSRGGEKPRWIVAPDTEEGHRKEVLERARRLIEGARRQSLEVEDDREGERPSRWRGMRRGRGGQMRFIVGDGDSGDKRDKREQDQARGVEGREPGQAVSEREEREEGEDGVEEGEAEGGGQGNAARDRVEEGSSGQGTEEGSEREDGKRRREADEQDLQAERQQEGEGKGRPRRKWTRGVRYGEEQRGREEQQEVREGMTYYGPHKVSGKWRRYVGTVEDMIQQQDHTGHVTGPAIVQWEDQEEGDEERLPYPVERLQVCPQGREMEIHGQLVPEQEARELEGEVVSTGRTNKNAKVTNNEAEGGREDEEGRQTKAGGKEQRGRKRSGRQRGAARGWGGQVATHEVVLP